MVDALMRCLADFLVYPDVEELRFSKTLLKKGGAGLAGGCGIILDPIFPNNLRRTNNLPWPP